MVCILRVRRIDVAVDKRNHCLACPVVTSAGRFRRMQDALLTAVP